MAFKFKKREPVLIANRGEIAIRIARTAKMLGFPTVAVYSDADRFSQHVKFCDSAEYIGGSEPKDSYLVADKIIAAAKKHGAKFVHPGFGFLSERSHFVEACEKAGLVFVGPSAHSMNIMGDKITARKTVEKIGMPGVPGSPGAIKDAQEAIEFARKVKLPILLKATAGGGGKGMRRVDKEEDIPSAFEGASREALAAFGDGSMYVEKYILEPHHVEIQVFGDGKGGAIHLGERECSIQRRHQKVWEESPSPILEKFNETRKKMQEAAVRVSREIKYAGAGTFEFIVDGSGDWFFLEMNTRLQVEHPVSEWNGPFLRWDSSYQSGPVLNSEVSMFYDPMIAKLSVWGRSRDEAVARLRVALDELSIEAPKTASGEVKGSLKTNVAFLRKLVRCQDAVEGNTTTDLIPNNPSLTTDEATKEVSDETAIALSLLRLTEGTDVSHSAEMSAGMISNWNQRSKWESLR